MPERQLARYCFLALIVAYFFFIAYASFFLSGELRPDGSGFFQNLRGAASDKTNDARLLLDSAVNLLLYMPLGLLVACWLTSFGVKRWWQPALLLGFLCSFAMELGQGFFADRYSDIGDIVSNGTGYVVGFWLWLAVFRRYGVRPESLLGLSAGDDSADQQTALLPALRFLYIAIFIVVSLLPMDMSVSPSAIYAQLYSDASAPPNLILNPFFNLTNPQRDIQSMLLSALAFLPLGLLSFAITGSQMRALAHCFALAIVGELIQIPVLSARSDVGVIWLAAIGGLVGMQLGRIVGDSTASPQPTLKPAHSSDEIAFALLMVWLLVLAILAWAPYQFEPSADAVRIKLAQANWVPFKLHLQNPSISAAIDIVREFFLLAPLGAIVGWWLRHKKASKTILLVAMVGFATAFAVDFSQTIVVGRFVDITDVICGTFGAIAGWRLSRQILPKAAAG